MWVASHMPPTGDLAGNPGVCPDWELNQQPFGSQASAQSNELHQPGLIFYNVNKIKWSLENICYSPLLLFVSWSKIELMRESQLF